MKLSQLYCNDERFKDIKFKDGFNVILGEITNDYDLENDSHNLGKSTLIELIDFMLLKEIDKKHFLKNKKFENHIFYMEIELNSGNFITIRRATKSNTKINFKFHNEGRQDFRYNDDWDYENLPITSKLEDRRPATILNNNLDFNILMELEYRKTVNYFFRTQDDYDDVFKLSKHMGKDVDWKPVLFELLGFDSSNMVKKYKLEEEISRKKEFIEDYRKEFKVDSGEIDKIKGLIEIKELNKKEVKKWLDNFDFYKKEAKLNKEVIEEIECKISKNNTKRYDLDFEIEEIKKALNESIEYNLEDTLEIYKEVKINFPDQLRKSYEQLLEFNKKAFIERKKYLDETLSNKIRDREKIDDELKRLNMKRVNILGELKDTNVFNKYNKHRDELIKIEKELERYYAELDSIDTMKNVSELVKKLNKEKEEAATNLHKQVNDSTSLYSSIRIDFNHYVKSILGKEAYMAMPINGSGNIEFEAKIVDSDSMDTEQGKGHSYRKILCACFDLAIIKNHIDKSFYRVIYHDGCLESLDPRKQKQYLNLVTDISEKFNIQYILTALESDLPKDSEYNIDKDIVLRLNDNEDDTGRLFGFSF